MVIKRLLVGFIWLTGMSMGAMSSGDSVYVNLSQCESPEVPPNRGSTMPGYYNAFILLHTCKNKVEITAGFNTVKITYEELPDALTSLLAPSKIESIDIYAGRYQPCNESFSNSTVVTALRTVVQKLKGKRVNTIRLVGVPIYNQQLIKAVHTNVTLVMLQNCDAEILHNALVAVQGCKKLRTLLMYGPAEFKDLWRALYGKKELVQLHLEQESGSQDTYGLKELIKTLPKFTSVILRCSKDCATNFTEFAVLNAEKFKDMNIISFRSDNQEIDPVGVEVSENLGPSVISLTLQGQEPISCPNMGQIAANALQTPKTNNSSWRTMYLKVEDDCTNEEELWRMAQEKLGTKTIEECDYPLSDCRKLGFTSVQLQRFL